MWDVARTSPARDCCCERLVRAMSGTTTRARQRAPVRELLTVAASAEYLGVCERTIRRMIHAGELKAYRIRRRGMIRIARADLDDLLSQVKPGDVQP